MNIGIFRQSSQIQHTVFPGSTWTLGH